MTIRAKAARVAFQSVTKAFGSVVAVNGVSFDVEPGTLVTLLGLTLPSLLSGAVILERIFAWPGMGNLFFESIGERDYPTIMGLVLMFSLLTLLGQLLADIFYALVDPRVSLS